MSCACMGPQNGEPLCPCHMAAARRYIQITKTRIEPMISSGVEALRDILLKEFIGDRVQAERRASQIIERLYQAGYMVEKIDQST